MLRPRYLLPLSLALVLPHVSSAQSVTPEVCATCHRQIAESYARTGMGRSFSAVTPTTRLPEFTGPGFFHRASQQQFTPLRRDGKYFLRRSQTAPDGRPVNIVEQQVDYILGSGNHARSYLHRTADNKLIEFPLSWYPENGGRFAMSPGFDRPNHAGFSREATYRCLFCHNAYPVEPPAVDWDGGTTFPVSLPQGIDCQRCHGPGAAHVQAASAGDAEKARAAIVNPARLPADRRIEVCFQCHLEATTMQLPATLLRPGRPVFSFLPGEPLSEYILHFDYPPGAPQDKRFDLVSAGYRLLRSACFRQSAGKLTCTTCHNPHQTPTSAVALQNTNRTCQGCHAAAIARSVAGAKHPIAANCVDCHMPKRRADDAIHMTVTDHAIERRPVRSTSLNVVEVNDASATPYAGEVVLNYPQQLPPTPANEIALAIAQVKDLANLPAGSHRLERAIADHRPERAEPYYEMATAFFNTNQVSRALPYYQEAAKREPNNWRYLDALARTFLSAGRPDLALTASEQGMANAPSEIKLRLTLALAQAMHNRLPDAVTTLRQASRLNPGNASVANSLGSLLLRTGDFAGAETALREAVRLQPEDAAARMNFADALLERGNLNEAKYQLQQAIRNGPSVTAARSAWSSVLAAGGDSKAAQSAYDNSLRGQLAEAHDTLGTILTAQGDPVAGIREYRLAIDANATAPNFLANLGLALAATGQIAEARQKLEDAVRRNPNLYEAQLKLGEIFLAAGQPGPAQDHLKKAQQSSDTRIRQSAIILLNRDR